MNGAPWSSVQDQYAFVDEPVEYYVEAETVNGALLRWPATAPDLNQTVVVVPN